MGKSLKYGKSNKTILAIRQKFFFPEVTPVQSITDTVLLAFWLPDLIIERKKFGKKWRTFLPMTNFFADYFFYWRLIFTDEYSTFLLQKKTFSIFQLKNIPILFDFKFERPRQEIHVSLIQLMFSDSQAKKFVGKRWRIILPVTKFFIDDLFCQRNFMPTFFFRQGTKFLFHPTLLSNLS